nr:MAG TPA: hypothetical protein [Caudoviricetes sp.]
MLPRLSLVGLYIVLYAVTPHIIRLVSLSHVNCKTTLLHENTYVLDLQKWTIILQSKSDKLVITVLHCDSLHDSISDNRHVVLN